MSYLPERRMGSASVALAVAGGLVVGGVALALVFWLLGMIAGIIAFAFKLAVLVGLAAAIVYAAKYFLGDHERV